MGHHLATKPLREGDPLNERRYVRTSEWQRARPLDLFHREMYEPGVGKLSRWRRPSESLR